MRDVLRLVRAYNLLIAAAGVLAGGWIALGRIALPGPLAWAALSGIGLGAFGNAANDLWDVRVDRLNQRADRPVAAGRIAPRAAWAVAIAGLALGLGAAAPAGWPLVAAGTAAALVMLLYSPILKLRPVLGNVAVAVVAGLPLAYGALAVGNLRAGLVPWVLAAWMHLMREIVKDVEDEAGDRMSGRRTLPVVVGARPAQVVAAGVGLLFIPASLLLPYVERYGPAYFVVALVAQMAVLVAATWLILGRVERVSPLIKGAMVVGIAALVAGRVA